VVQDEDISSECQDFVELVLHNRRFICANGVPLYSKRDCSVCFVYLKSGEWCRVDSGVQMFLTDKFSAYKPLRFLRVVKYPVIDAPAMLGKNLTVLNGNPSGLPGSVLVPVDQVLCTGIAVPKPLADTSKNDGHKRVVVPNLFL